MKNKILNLKEEVKVVLVFAVLFVIFILFVQLWKISSPNYQPNNFLDSQPRQEIDPKLWVNMRNQHGKSSE